jgi:hypothetical protein
LQYDFTLVLFHFKIGAHHSLIFADNIKEKWNNFRYQVNKKFHQNESQYAFKILKSKPIDYSITTTRRKKKLPELYMKKDGYWYDMASTNIQKIHMLPSILHNFILSYNL